MNAVLSVQGSAVPEEAKPSFLSRVFNKKKALKAAKVALPVAAVAVVTIAGKRLSRLSISHGVLRNLKLCVWQRKRAARLRKYSC